LGNYIIFIVASQIISYKYFTLKLGKEKKERNKKNPNVDKQINVTIMTVCYSFWILNILLTF